MASQEKWAINMPADSDAHERLLARLNRCESDLENVWQALRTCLFNSGVESVVSIIPHPQSASFSLISDPYDGSEVLLGHWRDKHGAQQGEIQVRVDNSVYAEVDVIRDHPKDARWFIESVTAWGSLSNIKTDLRLLPAV